MSTMVLWACMFINGQEPVRCIDMTRMSSDTGVEDYLCLTLMHTLQNDADREHRAHGGNRYVYGCRKEQQ